MTRVRLLLLSLLLTPLLARAAAQTGSGPGKLWLESRDGSLTPRSAEGFELRSLAEAGAVSVRVEGYPMPAAPGDAPLRAELALSSGDRLSAAVLGGDGDRLDVELLGGARLALDVEDLQQLVFPARGEVAAAPAYEAPASGDRLYWVRPAGLDRVDGTLEGFGAQGVEFDSVLGRRSFAWSEIGALFVEPLGAARQPKERARAVCVDLADGGRLRAELVGWTGAGLELAFDARRKLTLPMAALREVTADDGSVAFLSALTPVRVREGWLADDALGLKWPYRVDRSVLGTPLRAGERSWPRGLGVHAPSRLEFELGGQWSALRGAVAIDDSVRLLAYRGSVEFSIFLDGASEPAWKSGRVRGGDAPLPLPPLALSGVQKIALVVDMDERSFVADRADWLRLLLVR